MKKIYKGTYQGRTKDILQLILILSICIFIQIHSTTGYSFNPTKKALTNSYTEKVFFTKWSSARELISPHLYPGGTIFVNYTVLVDSHSNVTFITFFDDGIIWTPLKNNFTLVPGENFFQTSTMVRSSYDSIAALSYNTVILTENSNATVIFGYNVINSGTDPISLPTGIFLFGFIVLSSIISITKKKRNKTH